MDLKCERHREHDDELDLKDFSNSDFQSVGAERIPMKVIQNPSDIWIPAHLLKKREQLAEKKLNKPALFRTLQQYYPSFSTYAEPCRQPKSFSVVDNRYMVDSLNNCIVNFEQNNPSDRGEETTSVTKPSESSENDNASIYDGESNQSLGSSNENLESPENNLEPYDECEENIYEYIQSACSRTFIKPKDDNFKKSVDDIYSEAEFVQDNACTTVEEIQEAKSGGSCEYLNIDELAIVSCDEESQELINYPVAYKRPVIEENAKKQKNSKKKKNTQKKKILDVFSQDGNSDRMEPEVDEFYLSVKLREFQEHYGYEYQYPSLQSEESDFNQNSNQEYYSSDEKIVQREDISVPLKLEVNIPNEIENTKINEDFKNTCKIRIENIPKTVSEDQVQELVHEHGGQVKLLYFSSCRQFQIAEISMNSNSDPDWIIDCLNGTEPFGADTGILKIYKPS